MWMTVIHSFISVVACMEYIRAHHHIIISSNGGVERSTYRKLLHDATIALQVLRTLCGKRIELKPSST